MVLVLCASSRYEEQGWCNILVVGGNVSCAASLIFQGATLECKGEGTCELTRREVTLGA
jgi:hypothetical protein